MEHYKIRNSVLYNKRIFSKSSKWQIIVGCILALIISLCVATFIGFFPGGIITLLLMVIDYVGPYNIDDKLIVLPWFVESLLIFILCFLKVIINIYEKIRR